VRKERETRVSGRENRTQTEKQNSIGGDSHAFLAPRAFKSKNEDENVSSELKREKARRAKGAHALFARRR